ncbi:MAG: (d)CMP kinase [Rhodothermales bacterium]|nr:(d)CMP kinase [Rhodothermales bacterium]
MIIAIDGPAGSGKSTTARAVARKLGLSYLDTGAMYRAVALQFIRQGLDATDEGARDALSNLELQLAPGPDGLVVSLSGKVVTEEIRTPEVTAMASKVSQLKAVRERMVDEQRKMARQETDARRGVVLEGRDIGTVVFPNADLKVFLTADLAVRAQRRAAQMDSGEERAIRKEMDRRDHRDSTRAESPLRRAPDAVEIDTTGLDFKDQVARIVALAGERRRNNRV